MFAPIESEESSALKSVLSSGVLDTTASEAFHRICWLVSQTLTPNIALITLLNGQRYWARNDVGLGDDTVAQGMAPLMHAEGDAEVYEVNDAKVDPAYFDLPIVEGVPSIRFSASATIHDPSGFACGALIIGGVAPRKLTQSERSMLRCFADQVESELKLLIMAQEETNLRMEASRAFNAKSRFLSSLSHELRTPITGILGAADMLINKLNRSQLQTPEAQEERTLLRTIWSSASDLHQLLNESLDSAKVEAGGLHISHQQMDLSELMDRLRRHFSVVAESKALTFNARMNIHESLCEQITSDPKRLRQILFNVIHNAMKFTQAGEVSCDLELTKSESGCQLTVAINDTGVGMTPEQLERLFEPFEQSHDEEERADQGTGIGMTMVKQLTERMGGSVSVSSSPGYGTRVEIEIPVQPVDDSWVATPKKDPEPIEPTKLQDVSADGLDGIQLLVADDNAQNRFILEKVLHSWGCEVTLAGNGEEALEAARQHSFDVIVLDLHMPIKSGFEVAREVRKYTSSTRLIACSADTTQTAYTKCQEAGFDDVLAKPFDWTMLHQSLSQVYVTQRGKVA